MVSCYPDPDLNLPTSVLKGGQYALFSNGTIGEIHQSSENSNDYDKSPYTFIYHYPNQIVEYDLKEPDNISPRVSALIEAPFRWMYIFTLIGLFLIFHSQSWEFGALIKANVPEKWVLPVGIIAYLLVILWPGWLYEYFTKNIDTEKYIEMKHVQRSAPYIFRAGRSELVEMWLVFLALQRGAAAAALFIHEGTAQDTLITHFSVFNSFWLFVVIILAPFAALTYLLDLRRGKKNVKVDNIERFFEKLSEAIEKTIKDNEKPLDELISGGENERLELKASFWTNTEGDDVGKQNKELQDVVVKEVAAFLNTLGGILLIGVKDEEPFLPANTLEADLSHVPRVSTNDQLELHISQALENNLQCSGQSLTGSWTIRFVPYRDSTIIRIDIWKAPKFVLAYQPNKQRAKGENKKKMFGFYRQGSSSKEPSNETWSDHITTHWK